MSSDVAVSSALPGIISELRTVYGCHTIILYGSRARGEQDESSDYDLAGICETGEQALIHDARNFNGASLDAFIYTEAELAVLKPDMIRFRNAKVLLEKDGYGAGLIARSAELFKAGPKPLRADEASSLKNWIGKMLVRISRGGPEDVDANYRRVWLLHDLPEIYFKLRSTWYLGPKESFAWLRTNDPATYQAFATALTPDASRGAIRILAERILST